MCGVGSGEQAATSDDAMVTLASSTRYGPSWRRHRFRFEASDKPTSVPDPRLLRVGRVKLRLEMTVDDCRKPFSRWPVSSYGFLRFWLVNRENGSFHHCSFCDAAIMILLEPFWASLVWLAPQGAAVPLAGCRLAVVQLMAQDSC